MRRSLLALLVVAALGCASAQTQRKLIVTANEAQDAAAQTYDTAKAKEADASKLCADTLRAANKPMPVTADEVIPVCAAAGVTIPYDPIKLQKAAAGINILYDAVRAANRERVAAINGDITNQTAMNLATFFAQTVADLTSAGVSVPTTVSQAATLLSGGQ